MRKKFRDGAGQGPKQKNSQSKRSGERPERRLESKETPDGDVGREESGARSRGRRSKRVIKNARSLSDVLALSTKGAGGGRDTASTPAPQAGRAGGSRSGVSGRPQDDRSSSSRSRSNSRPGGRREEDDSTPVRRSPSPTKLTYIMNFQPPGAPRPEPPQAPIPVRPPIRPPIRSRGERDDPSANRSSVSPPAENKSERGPSDFRWPSDRVPKPDPTKPGTREEQRTARDSDGGRLQQRGSSKRGDFYLVRGIVKRHPDGYGFLIPDHPGDPDVYISRQSMTGVMTNDRVEAEVRSKNRPDKGGGQRGGQSGGKKWDRKRGGAAGGTGASPGRTATPEAEKDDRVSGEITSVLSRANTRIVGKYLPVDLKYGIIQDENRGWGTDLRIAAQDSAGAKEGDMVAVEILQYPSPNNEFTGRVVEKIGDLDNPINDVKRVIYGRSIPMEFSQKALEEARRYGGEVTENEMKGRENLRGKNLITIDGATARDFDDAVCVEATARGFTLLVAIADVSHYVKPGTALDQDAYERGTSTYFPNFVVPMLPEELSNELCSLKPHVNRLCFCCEMKIDHQGEILENRFFEGVMESKARVTYGEAQEVIDGKCPDKLQKVKQNILLAADLANILMAKRFREGSLDLEIPETQVVVDASGESVDIIKSERLFAHRLIEELMLVTNVCTARFFEKHKLPGIYRIHEEPKSDNIEALQRYLWNFGGTRALSAGKLQKNLTEALESMVGKPGAQVLNILTLRAMNQAKYSSENVGHFGLGFSHYSHFTSPIRRYPDLLAHRMIKSELYTRYRGMRMTEEELQSAATFLSACEQRSVKAERQLISIKKARFMRKFVGEEFEGIISSVTKFGCFVLLRQFDVDGLVKIEKLGNDRFTFDEENLRLVGQRTGFQYKIGDPIKVRIVSTDTEIGRIDFELTEEPALKRTVDPKAEAPKNLKERSDFEKSNQKRGGERKQEQSKKSTRKKASAVGVDVQKRGKAENDRGGVRKERISKRRGKN